MSGCWASCCRAHLVENWDSMEEYSFFSSASRLTLYMHIIYSIPQFLVSIRFSNNIQFGFTQQPHATAQGLLCILLLPLCRFCEFPCCRCCCCCFFTLVDSAVFWLCYVQFDFVKLLDGKALPRSLTDPVSTAKAPKGLLLSGLQETGFIEYMDPGTWHLALYNDGRNLEQVLLHSTPIGEED